MGVIHYFQKYMLNVLRKYTKEDYEIISYQTIRFLFNQFDCGSYKRYLFIANSQQKKDLRYYLNKNEF